MDSSVNGFAIVTGASGGIGREIVFSFAEAGAKGVICADIKGDDATKVAEESIALAAFPNFRSLGFSLDITDSQSIKNFIEFTVREFRRINYLVNAAGIDVEALVPFNVTSDVDMHRVLNVNANGAFSYLRLSPQ